MKFILRGFDILFLSRPVVLIPVWGFSIFGYWRRISHESPFDLRLLWAREHLPAIFYMVIFSLSVGAVYVLNQIADYKVDSDNDGFPLLVKSDVTIPSALIFSILLAIIAVAVPLAMGYRILSLFSVIAVITGVVYSFKPFYFSGRPFADFLTNAVGFGFIAFGVGWYLVPGNGTDNLIYLGAALPYFLMMCSGSICSTLPDYRGDRLNKKNTTAVVLGIPTAMIIAVVFDVAAVVYAYRVNDLVALLCAGVAFPIYIIYNFKRSQMFMEATYKVRGGIGMLLAGMVYPVFLLVAGVVFVGTWLYFRLRHNVNYPSLVPVRNEADEL